METLAALILQFGTVLDAVIAVAPKLLLVLGCISGACSAVAAAWSKPENSTLFAKVHLIVNALAFNVGKARNAE